MINQEEFKIISHSLGVNTDVYSGVKELPKEYFRNHFQADKEHDCWQDLIHLEETGLMSKRKQFSQTVFHVTKEGQSQFELFFSIFVRENNQ